MATELTESDFAEAIGVRVADLAALEKDGLPVVKRKAGVRYPLPRALTWYIDHAITSRVGGIPPRVNQRDFATLVNISTRQVKNLTDAQKLSTVVEHGRRLWPLPKANHEFISYQVALRASGSGEKLGALDEARLRKLNADAEASELALLKQRGELIDRTLAEQSMARVVQGLRAQLLQFPARYERDLVGLPTALEVRAVLKPAINSELTRLGAAVAQAGRQLQLVEADGAPDDDEDMTAVATGSTERQADG